MRQLKLISESVTRKGTVLIVTRKCGEGLFIGDDIRITILEVWGKQVRLGIEAPITAVVLREEIYQRIQEENHQATGSRDIDVSTSPNSGDRNENCGLHSINYFHKPSSR